MKKIMPLFMGVLFVSLSIFSFNSCSTDDSSEDKNTTLNADTIITLATPNLTAELADSSIRLCWDYITGVDSWRLARFIDADSDDRGTLLSSSFTPDGKGYTFTDSSSLVDGVRYRYELTALTSNGYTEARNLYLKDSATASVTITFGNLAEAANLSSRLAPVSLSIAGTGKAGVVFYPNAKVEYRAILVDSLASTNSEIIALKNGDTTGTTLWSESDSTLYDGTKAASLTVGGNYKLDTLYYLVFLARFRDTESFGTDWKYFGSPYGTPSDSLSMSTVTTLANLTSSTDFEIKGTKKASFTLYPLGDVEYRVGVASSAEEKYTKLSGDSLSNSEIESLTTSWAASSDKSLYTGSLKDTVSISGDYDIGTTYYAFVFVKLSALDDNYLSDWIRITPLSSSYFLSDSLSSTEVYEYAISSPSISITNHEKAGITFYPISTASYQVGTASSRTGTAYNYADVVLPSTSSSVTTSVSGTYSVSSNYYPRFKVKFKDDTYFGTSEDWIVLPTPSSLYDSLTVAEFASGSLTADYVSLALESDKATLSLPVDSRVTCRYAIVDSTDTTTINTVKGATKSSTYSAAESATTAISPTSSELLAGKATVTVSGTYVSGTTYTVILLALDSSYEKSTSRYYYYKVAQPGVTATVSESSSTTGISASDLAGKSYLATTAQKDKSDLPSGNSETLTFNADQTFTLTGTGTYALSGSGTYAVSGTGVSLYITLTNGDAGTLKGTISDDLKTITGNGTMKSSSGTYVLSFVYELTDDSSGSSSGSSGTSGGTTNVSASDLVGKYYLATTAQADKEDLPDGSSEALYFTNEKFTLSGSGTAAFSGGGTYTISGTNISFDVYIKNVPVDIDSTSSEVIYEDFEGTLTGSISSDFKTISCSGYVTSTSTSSNSNYLNFVFEYVK